MTRIQDLGEACDQAIKTLTEIMKGEVPENRTLLSDGIPVVPDSVRETAAINTLRAYFKYSGN